MAALDRATGVTGRDGCRKFRTGARDLPQGDVMPARNGVIAVA
jgi:hypothetical protein